MKGPLEELCRNLKETVVAVNLSGADLHVIQKAVFSGGAAMAAEHCKKNDLYYWASGRIVMAWQPDCVIQNIIAKRGFPSGEDWRGVKTIPDLIEKLKSIRENGFAERRSRFQLSLAVPVFDAQGNFHFGLGVTYSMSHDSKTHRQTALNHLFFSAKKLSAIF